MKIFEIFAAVKLVLLEIASTLSFVFILIYVLKREYRRLFRGGDDD
jgi:hypothetical protein